MWYMSEKGKNIRQTAQKKIRKKRNTFWIEIKTSKQYVFHTLNCSIIEQQSLQKKKYIKNLSSMPAFPVWLFFCFLYPLYSFVVIIQQTIDGQQQQFLFTLLIYGVYIKTHNITIIIWREKKSFFPCAGCLETRRLISIFISA